MRILGCIFFMLSATVSFGQSNALINKMALDLNQQLEGGQLRNKHIFLSFKKNEDNGINYSIPSNEINSEKIEKVLSQYVDSLELKVSYKTSIYFDKYSSKVYTFIKKVIITGDTLYIFPNYDIYFPSPRRGMAHLFRTIDTDLSKHNSELNTMSLREWSKPIKLLIDTTGSHSILDGSSKLADYLDKSLQIPWIPFLYHGKQAAAIIKISINKHLLLSDSSDRRDYYNINSVTRVLSEKYKSKWVRLEGGMGPLEGSIGAITVSLVFNPLTMQLENPNILNGDHEEAKEFITWLKTLHWSGRDFYWSDQAKAVRTSFYIDD